MAQRKKIVYKTLIHISVVDTFIVGLGVFMRVFDNKINYRISPDSSFRIYYLCSGTKNPNMSN